MKIMITLALMMLFPINKQYTGEKKIEWYTNYSQVLEQAKKQNKDVLLFFHGSDWCPPCMKMQKEVFQNNTFINAVSDKILFLDVDFPYKTKLSEDQLEHNKNVKKKFGLPDEFREGYPQVIIINNKEEILYQAKGYKGEGSQYLIDIISKHGDTKNK